MHKLRNIEHKRVLENVLNIIPEGFSESPFKKSKKKTRRFCASYKWDETKIRQLIECGDWIYCSMFCNE